MKKLTKQWISGIAINILFIAAMITFIKQLHWSIPFALAVLAFASPLFFKVIFGSEAIYLQWKEEGFNDKKTWISESDSFGARLIRRRRPLSLITLIVGTVLGLILSFILK
jgi:hypothetical protein